MPSTYLTDAADVAALADHGNHDAWTRFLDYYAPLLFRFHLRATRDETDAADLTQQTLIKVARAIGRYVYRPAVGCSFHAWLFRIARRVQIDHHRATIRRGRAVGGDEAVRLLESATVCDDGERDRENQEHARLIVRRAMRKARRSFSARAWAAFWRTSIQGEAVRDVAADLELSVIAVYRAQWAVRKTLRRLIDRLDAE